MEYTPIKKEIQSAEEIIPKPERLEELVVAFIAVEDGDDLEIAKKAITEIKQSLEKIGCKKLLIYPYAHLSAKLAPPSVALDVLKEIQAQAFDLDVSRAPFGWTKSYNIKVKGHPLAENSKIITKDSTEKISSALKSELKIQSFWHILTPDGKMEEITNFDFSGHKNLEILAKYEVTKKRNVDEQPPHVHLMKKMAIADYEPASDSGNIRFYPNGRLIKSLLEQYVTQRVKQYGGYEVETPIMYDSQHPSMVSYFNRFPARQYNINSEGKQLFLRFAACFGQFLMANAFQISYKNLPYSLYELTRYSFRREQTGELIGLRRLRAFTMPDCHAFCKDMSQAIDQLRIRFDLSRDVIRELGISENGCEMAIRLTQDMYNENKNIIHEMVKKYGKPVLVEIWKEQFFYFVLKWEFNYIDNLGKASALSTDQIDVENGSRYGIEFIDENNISQHPIILHNSPSGAIERIIYVLLEQAAADAKQGKKPEFPLWLAPTQVRILLLKEEFLQHSVDLANKIMKENIRVDLDDRQESIGKKIRDAEKEWIRYILVIGKNEVESKTLSVRDRHTGSMSNMGIDEFIFILKEQIKDKPFTGLNVPFYLSKRPQIMV